MITPRLLTPGQARRYLGGNEPSEYVQPCSTPRGMFYDRALLDAKLDQLSGLNRTLPRDDPESALQEWLAGEGGHVSA